MPVLDDSDGNVVSEPNPVWSSFALISVPKLPIVYVDVPLDSTRLDSTRFPYDQNVPITKIMTGLVRLMLLLLVAHIAAAGATDDDNGGDGGAMRPIK
ncbi:unnamed protein product [Onchocerca flexuosa]|uniref:Secreted protein n=1 Tax=Onchocerca flexuosa TaxID=387005 RepID=A0A183I6R4_9BILA|nr:unnamed protein product [Onchocerca flexuosa]